MRPRSLPGTNRLRFALHGGQRKAPAPTAMAPSVEVAQVPSDNDNTAPWFIDPLSREHHCHIFPRSCTRYHMGDDRGRCKRLFHLRTWLAVPGAIVPRTQQPPEMEVPAVLRWRASAITFIVSPPANPTVKHGGSYPFRAMEATNAESMPPESRMPTGTSASI